MQPFIHWKCESDEKKNGRARIHTAGDEMTHPWKDHVSHIGDAAAEIMTQIRHAAESNPSDAPRVIFLFMYYHNVTHHDVI